MKKRTVFISINADAKLLNEQTNLKKSLSCPVFVSVLRNVGCSAKYLVWCILVPGCGDGDGDTELTLSYQHITQLHTPPPTR